MTTSINHVMFLLLSFIQCYCKFFCTLSHIFLIEKCIIQRRAKKYSSNYLLKSVCLFELMVKVKKQKKFT